MLEKYDKCVKLYLANMERNLLSEDSIESYGRTFRMFRERMAEAGYAEVCTAAAVDFKLSKSDASLTTIDLYLRHLHLLSEFGLDIGILDETFVPESLLPPKKKVANERKKPYAHVLSEEQILQLITAEKPNYGRKSHTWLREKAEVTLLLQSGLRNSELRALTPNDLDFEASLIYARETKGDKPRYVSFPHTAQEAVRAYLASDIRPADILPSEPLFGCVSRTNGEWKPLERTLLSTLVRNYTRSILGEDASCRTHALRHGYSSVLLEHNVDMQAISESLGHSSLETTKIYAERFTHEAPAQSIGSLFDNIEKKAVS